MGSPGPTLGPSKKSPLKLVTLIAVVGAALVVVLAALWAAGWLFPRSTAGGGPPPLDGIAEDFDQAYNLSYPQAQNATGAPWTFVGAIGIGLPQAVQGQNSAGLVSTGCEFTPTNGSPSTLSILGTASNATPGEFASWIFFGVNASGGGVLLTDSWNDSAQVLGLVTGTGCAYSFDLLLPINAAWDVDSTVVAAAFDADGGSSFLNSHGIGYENFVLLGQDTASGSGVWVATYSTCGIDAAYGTGSFFMGAFYAHGDLAGQVYTAPSSSNKTC